MKNIFYKITAPDTGSINYLIATTEVDSPRHKREIAQEISKTPVFRQAKILISETGAMEDFLEHLGMDLWRRLGLEDSNDEPDSNAAPDVENIDQANAVQYNEHSTEKDDESNPRLDAFDREKFIAESLKAHAHQKNIPIVPLQTQTSMIKGQFNALKRVSMQPKSLAAIGFFATAPISVPILCIHNIYAERQRLKENYQDYMSGDYSGPQN